MKHFSIGLVLLFYFITQINSVPRYSFFQGNNISTIFINNGIYNYDWWTFPTKESGLIWPVSSLNRVTAAYTKRNLDWSESRTPKRVTHGSLWICISLHPRKYSGNWSGASSISL